MNKVIERRVLKVIRISMVGLLLVLSWGCHSRSHEDKGPKYMVTSPWRSTTNMVREYVAQIRAIQHIELRAFERGYLQNIFVDEGQLVKKDEKMFEIMPTLNQAEYKKRKAEVDLAEIEYKNTKNLFDKNVVSKNELALAKAKFEKAKADLELAKIHLDFTTIKAPFDGLMDRFHVRLGSLVDEGELLTTMSETSTMWVYFNVSEADYLNYKTHEDKANPLEVKLRMANGQIFDQIGKVETIEADFNNETGNIAFRANFPNPNRLLRHGETGNVLVEVPIENALLIPQQSTFEILDKKYVYVIDENNKIQSRQITVKEELPQLFVVSSGISEKDKILLEGLGKVQPGKKIDPNFIEPAKVTGMLEAHAE